MRLFFPVVLLLIVSSQVFWGFRAHALARKLIAGRGPRMALELAVLGFYVLALAFAIGRGPTPTRLTLREALFAAPLAWWVLSSLVAFLIAGPIRLARRIAASSDDAPSLPGRRFALAAIATPFAAGAYGLLYGRLDLETTAPRIRLARLPAAFHGFRIAQLSDIHIGPFMTAAQIRSYVELTNALKPDLIALTGDFVTWDASTQYAVVEALAGLRSPFGIFGCLGNHEIYSRTEDSITRLFAQVGIHILRQARVPLAAGGERLNLIGIDFPRGRGILGAPRRLEAVERLIEPDAVNILLSHTPATFDRAAELGVDLSLSGHTHGGQVALEFISPEIAPSRLLTPYVSGWFQKPGGQLYVNRGIGTIGVPIRLGARPEISVFELVRGV